MRIESSLNGAWKIQPDVQNQGKVLGYFKLDFDDSEWQAIDIPCHWELAIPKFYRDNPGVVWARKTFKRADIVDQANPQDMLTRLVFKGIFYYADVYLNGILVKSHEGYFDPFSINISNLLQDNNVIAVRVECRKEHDLGNKEQVLGTIGHWDASDPHANPGGIWNDVSLLTSDRVAIEHVRQITHLISTNLAKEHVFVQIDSNVEGSIVLRARYEPKNFEGETFNHEEIIFVKKGINQLEFQMELAHPALWWTHDYGLQNLYALTIECRTEEGVLLLDEATVQTGIKEFRMDRSGRDGSTWKMSLNGHRIFPKGTNYPPWQRLQTGTREKFDRDLQLFKDANMNMLRVHAHLERAEFYDACDEIGILLWQDLPLQWIYSKHKFPEIERQAQTAVRLFQTHPCIGIWCAHNEPFFAPNPSVIVKSSIFFALGLIGIAVSSLLAGLTGFGASIAAFLIMLWIGGRLWDLYPWGLFVNSNSRTLDPALYRLIVKEEEGQNAAIPYSGICELSFTVFRSPRLPPVKFGGYARFYTDFHYYAGWYNYNWKTGDYRYHIKWWGLRGKLRGTARFVTEYGAQAIPATENLLKFHERPDRWPPDSSWWQLLMEDRRFQKKVQDKWVKPENYASLEEYVEETQKWQAEVIKATTEMFRQEKYAPVAGLITFLGIDCFPAITWAIIDYYRTPKQAYEIVRDAFEPLYAMVNWPERVYAPGAKYRSPIYLSNDYWEPIDSIALTWELKNHVGDVIDRGNLDTNVEADCVAEIGRMEFTLPDEPFITLELSWNNPKKDDRIFLNRYRIDIGSSYWAKNF